ncbi:MAG: cation:H+ antiporter [Verrucomicrobiota bacterium]|jgi:cation:H+ antiporter|nr:cation:H+ antiporter [Verrucomicrobiota bacterium]MDK2963757.1 cation:H+ antiporter [Verrucomicrobiota bacterium]
MNIWWSSDLFLLLGGFVLLTVGAEALVRGASRLAAALGISPLVIGLTVVAFGTSAPEMAVSAVSGLTGQPNIALGNVIGSNIFNVLLILGLSALITPLVVSQRLIRLDVPVMIAASVLVFIFSANGQIGHWESAVLFVGIIVYTLFLIVQSRKENSSTASIEKGKPALLKDSVLILAGLGLLVIGSKWLVKSAVAIALHLGVSDVIVGLTVVAAGTSLPELATSVVAGIRGERDLAVGNVVGSNLFNLLAVLGLAGMFSPDGIAVSAEVLHFDFLVMLAVAAACLPVFFTGNRIARWEGALFLGYYIAYIVFLILSASNHAASSGFGTTMRWFVIPLTGLTLAVVTIREIRGRLVLRH